MKLKSRNKGSSLIIALMVIVVLSIIVVAFLHSSSVERVTSRSYADKFQAELMADAATEEAIDRIFNTIEVRPASAVFYSNAVAGRETRHLFLARYAAVTNSLVTSRVPLFSTAQTNFQAFNNPLEPPIKTGPIFVMEADRMALLVRALTAPEDVYTDLNRVSVSTPQGLVGLTNANGALALPGNWIYKTNARGKVIGRYAYWVDDETSKIDLATAGLTARAQGTNVSEISLAAFAALGVSSNQVTNLANYKNQVIDGKSPSLTRYALGDGTGISDDATWNRIRPFLTQYSLHDLRSPDGTLAANLNEVVTTTSDPAKIRSELQTLVTAITNNLPTFGERFYQVKGSANSPVQATPQASDPIQSNPLTYVKKLAANIRDYIDADNNATVILKDGSAYTGTAPDFIPYEAAIEDIPIIGKERAPYLNEFGLVARVINPSPESTATSGAVTLTVRFGRYIELFNPTAKDIAYAELGANPRVLIANQTPWRNMDASDFQPADVRLDLPANFVIPARGYAVLTTDGPPWNANQPDYLGAANNRYLMRRGVGPGTWSLLGTSGQNTPVTSDHEDYVIETAYRADDVYDLKLNGANNNSPAGCRERLLFVNDGGIIDYTLRIYTVGDIYLGKGDKNPTAMSTFVADGDTAVGNTNPDGSSGAARFVRGDPRANGEISELGANTSSTWKNGASPVYGNALSSLQATLGADNYRWNVSTGSANSWRTGWAEFSASGNGYVGNASMASVGELGFIYDPARYNISGFRTYGRTLRVGQPDDPAYNREGNSADANVRNWIGGLGGDSVSSTNYLKNAFLLANVFRTDEVNRGKLNPNGAFRSSSRVIEDALFQGYEFSTNGYQVSGQLTGKAFNTNALHAAFDGEMGGNRPFVGLGDLSRLNVFASSAANSGIAEGQVMSASSVSDGDREEVFRRTAGLLSTQSLSYSVYVVGQSGRLVDGRFKTSATVRKNTVVQFVPDYPTTTFPAKPASWKVLKPWYMELN
jgi:hypothetical protein